MNRKWFMNRDYRSHYNIDTGKIFLVPSATLYTRFHEEAHKEQHQTRCAIWRIYWYGRYIRGIAWLVILLIEFDAYRRARRRLERLGAWNAELAAEAHDALLSHVRRNEVAT